MLSGEVGQDFTVTRYAMMATLKLISVVVCYRDGSPTISTKELEKDYTDH